MKSFKDLVEGLQQEAKATYCGRCGTTHVPPSKGGTCPALQKESIEIKPSEFHAVRKGEKTAEQLAAEKKKPVGMVKGELNLHADHWSKGEAHYNKTFKEEVEMNEDIKVGDFVKAPGGHIHRVFGRDGNTLHTGKYHGDNKYGGTDKLHVTKATKVAKPSDVTEETDLHEQDHQMIDGKARVYVNHNNVVTPKEVAAAKAKLPAKPGKKWSFDTHGHDGERRYMDFAHVKEDVVVEATQRHKVTVTVSDPNHPMVTKRKEQLMKRVIVNADHKDHAIVKAKEYYKKKGYKVHDADYHSLVSESTMATESVELDEMTQGKEYSQKQLMDKIKSGNWEATHDIKPGKHVEMRHHTGKKVTVYVKEEALDEASPGWMLKVDSKLAAKVKANQDVAKKRQQSYGNPDAGKSVKEETQLKGDAMSSMDKYLAAIEGKANFTSALQEKTLTPAELKKREEVAKAIERENPGMEMGKKMAIATATAKKVAEEVVDEQTHPKTEKEKDLAKLAPPHDKITHADVMVGRGVKKEEAGASKEAEDRFHRKLDKLVHKTFGHSSDEKKKMEEMSSKEKMKRGLYNKEEVELDESHFKIGDKVKCDKSGMTGTVTVLDKPHGEGDEKYYTVKLSNGKTMKYAPDELSLVSEGADDRFKNLPGKATHLTNKDVRHPEHGIIAGSTTLRHLGGDNYEVRAGRAKGKTISLDKQHVQKMDEEVELDEAMISYSDFMGKIKAHKAAGNKIVDDKYTDKKAEYTSIDKDGYGRKVTHTASGQKMDNLGQVEKSNEAEPTEKRGRGRPAGTKSGARN